MHAYVDYTVCVALCGARESRHLTPMHSKTTIYSECTRGLRQRLCDLLPLRESLLLLR